MRHKRAGEEFPFLFGGTFIEARASPTFYCGAEQFPFLLGGAFIEANPSRHQTILSARISLPLGKGFQ